MKRKIVSIFVFLTLVLTAFVIMPTNVIAQDGDFDISVFPTSQNVNPGGSVTFFLTLSSIDGFDSPVTLSVLGLPDDATETFSQNPVIPTDYSMLTISTSEDTPTGSYTLTIIGTGGDLTHIISTTIEIDFGLVPMQFGTFVGRVTSCDNPGVGIEGVTVLACDYPDKLYVFYRYSIGQESFYCYNSVGLSTTTDENGYYTITDVPLAYNNAPRDYVLAFHIEGHSVTHNIATAMAGTITSVNMELCHAGLIGTVVDDDTGYPIEGANIYVKSEIPGSKAYIYNTVTNEFGEYSIYNIPLGADNGYRTYSVHASYIGYCYQIKTKDITLGVDSILDFSLIPIKYGTFTGKVTSCDNPGVGIEGVEVVAGVSKYLYDRYADGTENFFGGPKTTTNENGIYTINNVPLESYPNCNSPKIYSIGFFSEDHSITHHFAASEADVITTVDMELYHSGIIGTVVDDETGYPIEGVSLYSHNHISGSEVDLYAITNADGKYFLPNIPLGADNGDRTYSFKATADGYYDQTKWIDITLGATSTLDFRLVPMKYGSFAGQVTDLDSGLPIEGVSVLVCHNRYKYSRDENGVENWWCPYTPAITSVTTESDGSYIIENIPLYPNNAPRPWVVAFQIEGYSGTFNKATAQAGVTITVDMQLCHAGVKGKVVDAGSGDPIEGATLYAYSFVTGSEVEAYATTDEEGLYDLLNLPVGADHTPRLYSVIASAPGYYDQTKIGTIFCGGDITLDFAGPEEYFGTISGTVTDCTDGAPIEGALVGGEFGDVTTTDGSGHYTFTDVAVETDGSPKIWEVTVTADGYESQTKEVEVFADEESILDFCLLPPFQLYYLTVGTDPPNLATFEEEGWYEQGTDVELNAPSIEGYTFLYWDVDGTNEDYGENPITVTMDSDHTATAHYFEWFKIYGHKYFDGNDDGTWNNDEPYLDGWTINLDDTESVITGDGTWDTGYYEFTIKEPGTYMVSEDTSDIWTKTEPADDFHQVIAQNGIDVELNFGNWFEGGFITDSSLCYFDADEADGQQFRLLFTPDINNDPSLYKVTATNPGQFYYHVFYSAQDITGDFEITLADNFETQGATPVHVYSSLNVGPGGCIIPGNDISDDFNIVISGNSITVTPNEEYDGFIYINVHCDYALKQTYGYELEYYDDEGVTRGHAIKDPDEYSIYDMTTYSFSVAGPDSFADQDTIQNRNEFKKFRGIVGFLTDSSGNPIKESEIIITGPYIEGGSISLETDSDGFYGHSFFHKGKPKTYSIEFAGYTTEYITMTAGHFAEVNYQVP